MVECKDCPFHYLTTATGFGRALFECCKLKYTTHNEVSEDCQLQIIQYTSKDKPDSITFRPLTK